MPESVAALKIAGWQKQSLIDYPGKIAAVIFLAGCNLRCHYCHNHQILDAKQNRLPFATVFQTLRQRRDWLDAVVVSGGEPTVYPMLIPLLQVLRGLGLLIKLDTNGTRPAVVRQIVAEGLVDYVALDIKAPASKHKEITGMPIDSVLKTAKFLQHQKRVPYMFRTTLSPRLNGNDLLEMGQKIVNGAPLWQIQQCRIAGHYSADEVQKMAAMVKNFALDVVVKGV
ncbi:MAG: anaerobic ribonucleoside-triphosphate reductase activating protein [Prevotella sp.]|nr:anaerobic ribonucleoside-triphosphate reductase activating protein [Prevotella sp.]